MLCFSMPERSAIRLIRIDQESLCPELVEWVRIVRRASIPDISVVVSGIAGGHHELVFLEDPVTEAEVLALWGAGYEDSCAQAQDFCIYGL